MQIGSFRSDFVLLHVDVFNVLIGEVGGDDRKGLVVLVVVVVVVLEAAGVRRFVYLETRIGEVGH